MISSFQTLAQVFTERLLNTFFEGVAITVLAWAVLRLAGRQNSGTRFALWLAALACIVTLPFFAGSSFAPAVATFSVQRVAEFRLPGSWALVPFCAWAVISGLLLLRLVVGVWRIRKFRASCNEIDLKTLDPAVAGLFRQLSPGRGVKLCVSNDIAVPSVMGFFRPAVIFPAWLVPGLSPEELKTVLAHELAHLRRWDDWTNLFQKIVKALFFFHPAVWWIESRLSLEREMACDDMVLAQSASPRAYAASLISFAEKIQQGRGFALAQAFVGRVAQMSLRMAQILDADRPTRTGVWKPVLGVGGAALTLVFFAAPYAPRLVSFESDPQSRVSLPQLSFAAKGDAARIGALGQAKPSVSEAQSEPKSEPKSGPKMIPVVFHAPVSHPLVATRLMAKASARLRPKVSLAFTRKVESPDNRETLVVFQSVVFQSTQYDAGGAPVWTLCIWTLREGNSGDRQIESAIVMNSI